MNNWKVVSTILFGWGSVFLFQALFTLIPIFDQTTVALAASAPYFALFVLFYVCGAFSYYKGQEKTAPLIIRRKVNEQASSKIGSIPIISKEASEQASSKISPKWFIPVGASATVAVLAAYYFIGVMSASDMILGIIFPILQSIAAGLLAVLYTCLIVGDLD